MLHLVVKYLDEVDADQVGKLVETERGRIIKPRIYELEIPDGAEGYAQYIVVDSVVVPVFEVGSV